MLPLSRRCQQETAGGTTLDIALREGGRIGETAAVEEYLYSSLLSKNIRIFGVPRGTETKIPLFSFVVEGAHHEDLALILDKMGVAVRSGQMCAEPLMDRFGVTGMIRVSLAPYNTMEEAEYFVKALEKAISMLV